MARLRYKFVEVAPVTAQALEEVVNTWVVDGWGVDEVRFVGAEAGDGRPALAFVSFVRESGAGVIELGELDLGAAEPYEVDVDWGAAVGKPGVEQRAARRAAHAPPRAKPAKPPRPRAAAKPTTRSASGARPRARPRSRAR